MIPWDRSHRRTLRPGEQHAVPFHAAGAGLAVRSGELAGHRPGETAAQLREGVLAVGGEFRHALLGAAQLAHQLLEAFLLLLEALEFLRTVLRFGVEGHQRAAAALARLGEARELALLPRFERRQPLLLGRELRVEPGEIGEMRVDGRDLRGARTPEILVVHQHAPGLPGVALVEQ